MNIKPKIILACDDEPYVLESVAYIINKEGYKVITADNGKDALQLAVQEIPNLILLDVNMPYLTGYEVCQQLKSNNKTKNICIVMLTANVQASDLSTADQVGADGFISKPFSPRELKNKLHELLA